ncbi:beta-lactamase family protein [Parabacteroides sp. OttesenSCG-928-G07]|nr:beta-lactamase family protein [Parabacteroides sp. OttesenSCG-928-G21]MDL2278487.1 beta-lactamase family protein [Parabacteroides sp. OttesenSCG-928-G07]
MNTQIYKIFTLLLVSTSILISCSSAPQPSSTYEDGLWRRRPETQGVISENILNFVEAVEDQQLELHSLMILRHGRVIAEGWWYPYRCGINHVMHSVSKTFTSSAVGIAVGEKLLTVDDKVISFFPDDLPPVVSPYLQQLTVKHLLTMSVGHEEAPVFYVTDPNWVKSFLATPIVHEPGTVYQYSSYATYMLSAILQKVTGQTVKDYLQPRLFEPLGIKNIDWETDTRGINTGGWGMRIKTADMAKLGQLYLQKGQWYGKQLIPETWIDEATTPHIYQNPNQQSTDDWNSGYGYQLWICTHDAFRADGANGQFIVVVPEQDLVVSMTGQIGNMQAQLKLVWEHLLPAMNPTEIAGNEMMNDMLTSKLTSLKLPDPFRTPDKDTLDLPKAETRSYTMEKNELNITALTFDIKANGDCHMYMTKDNFTYSLSFMLDNWAYGTTDKPGPYFLNPRRNPKGMALFDVAGYNSWTKRDELKMRLLYLGESLYEDYICTFAGNQMTVQISNRAEPGKTIIITGNSIN